MPTNQPRGEPSRDPLRQHLRDPFDAGAHLGSSPDAQRLALSALCDGESAGPDVQASCALWCASAQARADWHTWSLIGDAMRADSLCASVSHDAAFVARLRERLAREPVVLAPAPLAAPAGAATRAVASRWASAGAVAAGLAVVAGAVVMLRSQPADEATLLAAGAASAPLATGTARVASQDVNPAMAGYLYAHRQYAPTAMPGGVRPVSLQPQQP